MTARNNEWYTPAPYIDAVRQVMGNIILDPASCSYANETIQAETFFTENEDGLSRAWYGTVFLNPPWMTTTQVRNGPSTVVRWIRKLLEEYQSGRVQQAILLTTCSPDRKWFQPLWEHPICFPHHQIVYNRPDGKREHIYAANVFVYFGREQQRFTTVFSKFGPVAPPLCKESFHVS